MQGSIAANSVIVEWPASAPTKSANSNAAGVISGDGTGKVDPATGRFSFWPNVLPAIGTEIRLRWLRAGSKVQAPISALNLVLAGNTVTGTIPDSPLIAGQQIFTLVLDVAEDVEVMGSSSLQLTDDGTGKLVDASGIQRGTINLTTGAFSITAPSTAAFSVKKFTKNLLAGGEVWSSTVVENRQCSLRAPGLVGCWYLNANNPESHDQTFALAALSFDLTPFGTEVIANGSVRFTFGGRTYVDRSGILYSNVDQLTGSGEQSGTIDYNNGTVKITKWTEGANNAAPVLQSLLTYVDAHTVASIAFRTPGAPVRPGSLYLQCYDKDGDHHDITVPASGVINSGIFHGTLDHDTGVLMCKFGTLVNAADYTSAIWYDETQVDANGKILKPVQVHADSVRFNCVTYSYMPLEADIIGIDPVRLPTDGRVPVYRKGSYVVLHNTSETEFPNGVMAGQTLNVGRERLAYCIVQDSTGKELDSSLYSVNLDTGVVTLGTPLILTGYTQPLKAVHRIEDRGLLSDVEISGRVTLTKALSHDYPAAGTYLSSALIIDDMWSRVTNVFEQKTWNDAWADTVVGDSTTAKFNATDYPVTVTNRGAMTERYALVFTSSTAFKVYGEHLGMIATGDINSTCAPSNPNYPSVPLFSIDPRAFGTGWAAGNAIRFNVIGADAPLWVAQTVLQSDTAIDTDYFALQARGNVNKE